MPELLSDPPRANLLLSLWASLSEPVLLWQIAAVASCLVLAWALGTLLKPRIAAINTHSSFGREAIAMLRFPLLALVFTLLAQVGMKAWSSNPLLVMELAVTLLTAAIIIRLAVVMLRQVFAASGWRDTLIRIIAWVVWIGVALHVMGLLPDFMRFLDALGFTAGKTRISLLLVLQGALSVAATLLIALWLGRFVEARAMAATDVNINLRVMISKLAQALLVLLAILLALPAVGIDLTVLSVFGGALGVGLGFGLQKIASNYISGFIILLDRSVQLGDLVTIDNHTGKLSKMTSRYVVVRSLGGEEAIIPNDTLITSTVVNQSYTDKRVRQGITVQVSYESDLDRALQILTDVAKRQSRVLPEPSPKAFVVKFADSGVDLELGFWVNDPEAGTKGLRSDLHREIWVEFRANGIDIPYPQRVLRVLSTPAPQDTKPQSKNI